MTTVSNGQTSTISSGHTSTGWIVDAGGVLTVLNGGTISNTNDSGGIIFLSAGGKEINTTVADGGDDFDAGTTSSATISGGFAEQVVQSGAASIETTIDTSGIVFVSARAER